MTSHRCPKADISELILKTPSMDAIPRPPSFDGLALPGGNVVPLVEAVVRAVVGVLDAQPLRLLLDGRLLQARLVLHHHLLLTLDARVSQDILQVDTLEKRVSFSFFLILSKHNFGTHHFLSVLADKQQL